MPHETQFKQVFQGFSNQNGGKNEAKFTNNKHIETIILIILNYHQNTSRLVFCWFQGIQVARKNK